MPCHGGTTTRRCPGLPRSLIRLRGKPGHRRVVVPPWHGIDTENVCFYCF